MRSPGTIAPMNTTHNLLSTSWKAAFPRADDLSIVVIRDRGEGLEYALQ
jgi:hypothetical protein